MPLLYDDRGVQLYLGDARAELAQLPLYSVQAVVTSPPFWGQRSYDTPVQQWGGERGCEHQWDDHRYYVNGGRAAPDSTYSFSPAGKENAESVKRGRWRQDRSCQRCGCWEGELGLEPSPELYVAHLVEVFESVKRVLRQDGTAWVVLGDTYAGAGYSNDRAGVGGLARSRGGKPGHSYAPGVKETELLLLPARVALALSAAGWYLRAEIAWAKPNPKPGSGQHRPVRAHDTVLMLAAGRRYFYNAEETKEPGKKPGTTRYQRDVWPIPVQAFRGGHGATFPERLAERCIRSGTREGDTVLDPFVGAGTTALVARRLGRKAVGIELSENYAATAQARLAA